MLSSLPPPDATNPTSTSIYTTQSAIHNSLAVYEELISLTEREEETFVRSEFDKRRTRLGGPKPEQLKKDIGLEVWRSSKVNQSCEYLDARVYFSLAASCVVR